MPKITVDLLRRRAEHNEGCLADLEEIALHQQDIEKIEVIGDCCRKLKILYLCNNYISVIEGLHHLKWLTYLNLAVNNITVVSGLDGCESLERLDLTLNFIADLTSVQQLEANPALSELHLTGNPCTKLSSYRGYVVHTLPHLTEIDGSEVTKAERIHARQEWARLEVEVSRAAAETRAECAARAAMRARGDDPFPARYNAQGERVYGHTPEERLQMLHEQQEKQQQQEEQHRRETEGQPGSLAALRKAMDAKPVRLTAEEEMAKYGRLLMRNEAKLPFTLQEEEGRAKEVVVTVDVGKFISTALIDVSVEVHCVRVTVKGKLLQLPVEAEMAASRAQVQRSSTTGQLKITIPTVTTTSALPLYRAGRGSAHSMSASASTSAHTSEKEGGAAGETIVERVGQRRHYCGRAKEQESEGCDSSRRDTGEMVHGAVSGKTASSTRLVKDGTEEVGVAAAHASLRAEDTSPCECARANTLCSID